MKKNLILILILSISSHFVNASEPVEKVNQEIPESISSAIAANDLLSDEDVLAYLNKVFKYMPDEWDKLLNEGPSTKVEILQNFRNHHSYNGLKITDMIKSFDESPEFEEMMAQIWAEDTLGVEYAESVLSSLTKNQYLTVIQAAQTLIKKHQTNVFLSKKEEFPEALSFLEIKRIKISNNYCEIFLYKGMGSMKAIGFSVKQEQDGSWKLSHFNYLKSYDHIPIELD